MAIIQGKKRFWGLVLLFVVISILANFVLFSGKFPTTVDFSFHQLRLMGLMRNFQHHQFLPRINTVFMAGYGYPIDLFYSSIFLSPIAIFVNWGVSLQLMLTSFYLVATFLTLSAGYFATKIILQSSRLSLIVTLLYTLSSLRYRDLYWRAGFGTVLVYVFVPLALLGFWSIMYQSGKQRYWLVVGIGGLLLTHIISAFIVVTFLGFWFIFKWRKINWLRLWQLVKASGLTILFTAFFLFPMLEQMKSYQIFATVKPVYLIGKTQYSLPFFFRFNFVPNNLPVAPVTFSAIILTFFCLRIFLRRHDQPDLLKIADKSALLSLFIIIIGSTVVSWSAVSQVLPIVNTVQFTIRFLIIALPFASLAAGVYVYLLLGKLFKNRLSVATGLLSTLLVILAMMLAFSYTTKPNKTLTMINPRPDSWNIGAGQEYLPLDTQRDVLQKNTVRQVIKKHSVPLTLTHFKRDNTTIHLTGVAQKAGRVTLPLIFYKGYAGTNKGQKLVVGPAWQHLLSVQVAQGTFDIKIAYAGTLVQHVSLYVSLLTVIVGLGYFIVKCWLYNSQTRHRKIINN